MSAGAPERAEVLRAAVLAVPHVSRTYPAAPLPVVDATRSALVGTPPAPDVEVDDVAVRVVVGVSRGASWRTADDVLRALRAAARGIRPTWDPAITVTVGSIDPE